jgi:hypothetical protein
MRFTWLAVLLLAGCSPRPDYSYWVKQGAEYLYFDSSGRNWAVVSLQKGPLGTRFKVVEQCSEPPTTSVFDFLDYAKNYASGYCSMNAHFKNEKNQLGAHQ